MIIPSIKEPKKAEKREFVDWYLAKPFVGARCKLIAYSRKKTNGLMFYLWVISWLRSHGVEEKIVFTVDHGEEWGGKSWMKIRELKKLISGFGGKLKLPDRLSIFKKTVTRG